MKKMLVLYRTPDDPDAFLAHYRARHLPLAEKVPGLKRVEVTRITRTLVGEEGTFFLAELYFQDDAFRDAMRSPENASLGADLANFALGLATVMVGDVVDL